MEANQKHDPCFLNDRVVFSTAGGLVVIDVRLSRATEALLGAAEEVVGTGSSTSYESSGGHDRPDLCGNWESVTLKLHALAWCF